MHRVSGAQGLLCAEGMKPLATTLALVLSATSALSLTACLDDGKGDEEGL